MIEERKIVHLEGELTIYRAAELKDVLVAAASSPAAVEVDLADVSALDTAGVQLLLLAKTTALARGGDLTFTGHSAAVAEVLDLLGLRGDL